MKYVIQPVLMLSIFLASCEKGSFEVSRQLFQPPSEMVEATDLSVLDETMKMLRVQSGVPSPLAEWGKNRSRRSGQPFAQFIRPDIFPEPQRSRLSKQQIIGVTDRCRQPDYVYPVIPVDELESVWETDHFLFCYSTEGPHAVNPQSLDGDDIPDYINHIHDVAEAAYNEIVFEWGIQPTYVSDEENRIHIAVMDIASFYPSDGNGYHFLDSDGYSLIVIDSDESKSLRQYLVNALVYAATSEYSLARTIWIPAFAYYYGIHRGAYGDSLREYVSLMLWISLFFQEPESNIYGLGSAGFSWFMLLQYLGERTGLGLDIIPAIVKHPSGTNLGGIIDLLATTESGDVDEIWRRANVDFALWNLFTGPYAKLRIDTLGPDFGYDQKESIWTPYGSVRIPDIHLLGRGDALYSQKPTQVPQPMGSSYLLFVPKALTRPQTLSVTITPCEYDYSPDCVPEGKPHLLLTEVRIRRDLSVETIDHGPIGDRIEISIPDFNLSETLAVIALVTNVYRDETLYQMTDYEHFVYDAVVSETQ